MSQYEMKQEDRFVVREFKPAKIVIAPNRKRSSFLAEYLLKSNQEPDQKEAEVKSVIQAPPPKKAVDAKEIRKLLERMQPWKKPTVGFDAEAKPAEEEKITV